ncbi:hypothetical protein GCM10023155_19680 [Bremerella cremea]
MPPRKPNQVRIKVVERVCLVQGESGIWRMDFHYQGHRRRTTKTRNLKVARAKAILLAAQLIDGTFTLDKPERKEESDISIADAVDQFMAYRETEGNRPGTISRYKAILIRFRDFAAEANVKIVSKITLPLVDRYRNARKPKISGHSLWQESRLLKDFCHWCYARGYSETDVLANERYQVPHVKQKTVLTLEQVNQILENSTPSRQTIFSLLAFTGMRSGECRNLRVEDVDLENNVIHIRSRPGLETKTGKDWTVPIHPRLRELLEHLKPKKKGWYFTAQASDKYPKGDNHIDPDDLNDDFKVVLKKLKIPAGKKDGGFTLHSLRHFFKTYCLGQRIPREYVDAWQGHAPKQRTASDHYVHVTNDDSQRPMLELEFPEKTNAAS